MIRLIQRRLIIPRGDTGTFTVPVITTSNTGDAAIFYIFDTLTRKKIFEKIVEVSGEVMTIEFNHNDTVNLPVGKYVWDIKFYQDPVFADGMLINGKEIDSYYAAFTLPVCEIRETGDNMLMSPDSAQGALSPQQLDIISAAISQSQTNVLHYPKIIDGFWHVWDAAQGTYVNTNVSAEPVMDEYVRNDELAALTTEDLTSIINGN